MFLHYVAIGKSLYDIPRGVYLPVGGAMVLHEMELKMFSLTPEMETLVRQMLESGQNRKAFIKCFNIRDFQGNEKYSGSIMEIVDLDKTEYAALHSRFPFDTLGYQVEFMPYFTTELESEHNTLDMKIVKSFRLTIVHKPKKRKVR